MLKGNIIKLKGISRHGKNRVNENGSDWLIISTPEKVGFSNEINCWVKLKSLTTDDVRIVKIPDDENFEITEASEYLYPKVGQKYKSRINGIDMEHVAEMYLYGNGPEYKITSNLYDIIGQDNVTIHNKDHGAVKPSAVVKVY